MKHILRKYKHIVWALYLPVYFISFYLLEKWTPGSFWETSLPIDGKIPFIEQFVLFYISWYPNLILTGFFLLIKDPEGFKRYMWSIMIGFSFSLLFCLLVPNCQELRPQQITDRNIFAKLVGCLYQIDTNTNVLPSMHVIGVTFQVFAVFRTKAIKSVWIRVVSVVLAVLTVLSTLFIKQHAVLDVAAGLIVSGIVYVIVYVLIGRKRTPAGKKEKATVSGFNAVKDP